MEDAMQHQGRQGIVLRYQRVTCTTEDGKSWLEVGQYVITRFQNTRWRHTRERYVSNDPLLQVQFLLHGRYKQWVILVPEGYPYSIIECTVKRNKYLIWSPEQWESSDAEMLEDATKPDFARQRTEIETYLAYLDVYLTYPEDKNAIRSFMTQGYTVMAQLATALKYLEARGIQPVTQEQEKQ